MINIWISMRNTVVQSISSIPGFQERYVLYTPRSHFSRGEFPYK